MAVSDFTPAVLENELRSSLDTRYHWSSTSQSYTPVSVLMQYLAEGWHITPLINSEEHWYGGGGRHVTIYDFELTKGSQELTMRVKANPVVRRLLRHQPYQIIQRQPS